MLTFAGIMGSSKLDQYLFGLLRMAVCGEPFAGMPTAEEWAALYLAARQQSVIGVVYAAVEKLPKEQQPPVQLTMQWMSEAEAVRGLNQLQYQEAARLTKLFGDMGRRTVILKGQANALLYPNKYWRQPGDIDIWVEGGRDSVMALLEKAGIDMGSKAKASYHHVHLPPNENGVTVEVHYWPSSGNMNPITNWRLQKWLMQELDQTTPDPSYSGGGYLKGRPSYSGGEFNAPSMRFALVMQLAHIQRHFLAGGIGLRQICDYLMLLRHATEEDRQTVADKLNSFGLRHAAEALMWVLGEVLHLDAGLMVCRPDSYRGEWMLREIMVGCNFGKYAQRQQYRVLRRVMESKHRRLKLLRFDFWEVFWGEVDFWKAVVRTLPKRIKYRTLSLKGIPS